jgi:hypothetical protein
MRLIPGGGSAGSHGGCHGHCGLRLCDWKLPLPLALELFGIVVVGGVYQRVVDGRYL